MYRDGVVEAISGRPDLELAGACGDGRAALQQIRELKPDVALLDLKMPELTGIEVISALERDGIETRVVLLSAYTDGALVYEAVAAGAAGYLTKDSGRQTICDALIAVSRGDTVFSPQLQSTLADQVRQRRTADAGPQLTPREREILVLTSEGRSAREIAEELYLSPTTVKTHLGNLYEKLGVSDRAAAVAEAMRRRMLE
ncbi:MAG: two-component system, NarL family, nitrate/nitrite response regulator NarL [Solirubrobacteraceae bacterium]|nr:two-component system, NarL family, nitrate/nitrite response regulator NarL [Solirubrobacteraceae bacterium]